MIFFNEDSRKLNACGICLFLLNELFTWLRNTLWSLICQPMEAGSPLLNRVYMTGGIIFETTRKKTLS